LLATDTIHLQVVMLVVLLSETTLPHALLDNSTAPCVRTTVSLGAKTIPGDSNCLGAAADGDVK
jgi:hypothetical protein